MALIRFTKKGLYCEKGDFYIDPWRKVPKALITHGHSDHARNGMGQYLTSAESVPILQERLGKVDLKGISFGEKILINGVDVSFHPAGHILGSAQIRVSHKGETWVVSGDYKTVDDGISGTFSPIKCQHFITETTFGLPVYRWKPQSEIFNEIHQWWSGNVELGRPSVIHAYSLGKAQRLIHNLDRTIGSVVAHPAIIRLNEAYARSGHDPGQVLSYGDFDPKKHGTPLVITPSNGNLPKGIKRPALASASGWMRVRGARRRRNVERGFVLSDHADWPGLNEAIEATGAENVYVTHGYTTNMMEWLRHKGKNAHIVSTEYGEEDA